MGSAAMQIVQGLDSQHRDDEPQRQGTAVSHEDGGRMPVEEQKCRERSNESHGEGHDESVIMLIAYNKKRTQYHDTDARGQAVQTIYEVQSIGKPCNRKDRKGKCKPSQSDGTAEKRTYIINEQTIKREKNRGDDEHNELGIG